MELPDTVLAVSAQQTLGITIVALLVLGWAVFLVVHLRSRQVQRTPGEEIELAPNRRPYLDDEAMEGRRLTGVLTWGLVTMTIIAAGLPLYWLKEPGRQAGADRGFDRRAVQRGFIMFQASESPVPEGNIGKFGCGNCHGAQGQGGSTPYVLPGSDPPKVVTWEAPALDTVLLRFNEDEVRRIIVYGRPNTPMPPWGIEGGGAMNEQQVGDLIAYIRSIQLTPKEAQAKAAELGTDGRKLFEAYCARCHTEGWSYGEPDVMGGGAFGPNLTGGSTTRQFPETEDMIEFITVGSDFEKPYGVRGIGSGRMPGFGVDPDRPGTGMLTEAQIRAIVRYERGL